MLRELLMKQIRKELKNKYNYLDSIVRRDISSLNKQVSRKDGILLDSGFYNTEAWGALKKCWKGYKIAKSESDYKKMEYYARGIRKFQRELKVSVADFPQFDLVGRKMPHEQDAENVFDYGNSYAQVEKELEQYDLQVKQEQELNPYRIEPEENLPKEQEEHFRQIQWYYMAPGSFVS